jgi:antirestriction protein ArdC
MLSLTPKGDLTMKAKKESKKVAFVDRNKEFYLDIQERMILKIQHAKDNNIHLGDALGYGSGRPGRKGTDAKTVERESVVVRPTNFSTGTEYSGSNYNKFSLAVALNGYKTGWFGTYKQWEAAGCKVIKGSKSYKGRIWLKPELTEKQEKENEAAKARGDKEPHAEKEDHPAFFNVFNLDQVEGVTPEGIALIKELQDKLVVQVLKHVRYIPAVASVPPSDYFGNPWYKIEALDNIKFGTVKIYTDSKYSCGCYNHKLHRVYMPPMETGFKSSGNYYKTLLHELAHSTMKDMSRPISTDHSSATYAREELIAEMTAWVMSVDLGIFAEDDKHPTAPAYLDHWLSNMKKSPDYLREVMSDVNKICHAIRQAIK